MRTAFDCAPRCMGHAVGCLSMPLRLFFASLPTVKTALGGFDGRVWRGADARQLQHLPGSASRRSPELQSTCSCPSTPSPRLIRSRVSAVDLQRAPARCSIRPVHRSKLPVAVCSRADASHGLFMMSTCRPGEP